MFSNKRVVQSDLLASLKKTTAARIGIGHVGGRYTTEAALSFREDWAFAKDTVHRDVNQTLLNSLDLIQLKTLSANRADYLRYTHLGKRLDNDSIEKLAQLKMDLNDVALIVSDGLSAQAFENNVPHMLPLLEARLKQEHVSFGSKFFVKSGRVAVMDHIGEILKPQASLILLGERPGLSSSDSLSGYFEYQPGLERIESDRNVLSNIHAKGIPPTEAALMLADALIHVLKVKKSGMTVRFNFS